MRDLTSVGYRPPAVGAPIFQPGMTSPNHNARRGCAAPTLVVMHYTAMRACAEAARVLCTPDRQVSAHYLISEQGEVLALVPEDRRAWHAGVGVWRGITDVNSHSVGIELCNNGRAPFSAPLMAALEDLIAGILSRWGMGPEGVIGHADLAPTRKRDPGPKFDWRRLARQGLAVWPDPAATAPPDWARFRADARAFGYGAMEDDLLLETVRYRFRPWGRGPLAPEDAGAMADLAARYG